ncbi:MAG: DUF1467 family protein [Pseudomonadota bacterium]
MTITGAIVLYAVIWFMGLFVALPLRLQSQEEAGEVVPGTPPSAPADPQLRRKLRWVTVGATLLWLVVCGVIVSGLVTVDDIDISAPYRVDG